MSAVVKKDTFRGVWPFVFAALVCIVILTFFPQLATWLPSVSYGR